jgi:HNH endonuclease
LNGRDGVNAEPEKRRDSLASMESGAFWELGDVTDRELQAELAQLLANGARTEARIIAHLAAVEERRLHLEAGHPSLFDYCCRRLGLSENEAFHRITAARLARRFPVIFGLLERRAVHLTSVCLLRDYLTPENHRELLEESSGKTKFQVQEMLARRFPRPDVASTIRKLPSPRARAPVPSLALPHSAPVPENSTTNAAGELVAGAMSSNEDASSEPPSRVQVASSASSVPRSRVEPLSAARYRIQLNASAQLKQKLDHALDLLSHAIPSRDLSAVIERALDSPIERTERERFAQTKSPRRSRASDPVKSKRSLKSRAFRAGVRGHVPNDVKRQIAARDGLQCTFVGSDGQRCTATKFTQIHHEEPWAHGGGETVENLRMLCAAHNRLLAEREFGRALVAERIAERPSQRTARGGGPR